MKNSKKKMPTTQIRPSVTIETAMVLQILSEKEGKSLGVVLEEILQESEKFKKTRERLYSAL